jgi:Ca2+-binding RTX toxin-like protein
VLNGGAGRDRLDGGAGNDKLNGGAGPNTYLGGAGRDIITAANGRKERVNCGAGRDRARADRTDKLRGCESVKRAKR